MHFTVALPNSQDTSLVLCIPTISGLKPGCKLAGILQNGKGGGVRGHSKENGFGGIKGKRGLKSKFVLLNNHTKKNPVS